MALNPPHWAFNFKAGQLELGIFFKCCVVLIKWLGAEWPAKLLCWNRRTGERPRRSRRITFSLYVFKHQGWDLQGKKSHSFASLHLAFVFSGQGFSDAQKVSSPRSTRKTERKYVCVGAEGEKNKLTTYVFDILRLSNTAAPWCEAVYQQAQFFTVFLDDGGCLEGAGRVKVYFSHSYLGYFCLSAFSAHKYQTSC